MLKPVLAVSAAILFAIAALTPTHAVVAASTPQEPTSGVAAPANTSKSTPASREKAKKIYAIDCALCHGDNGNGKTDLAKDMGLTLADWTDPKTLANHPDQELFLIIRNGKDKMPAEDESRAKKDDVYALIAYIREMSKNQPAQAAPATPAADATTAPPPADAPKPNR
ncbi:MAG: c-type cytochrome [Terracidiphilus sp.]|jgi:cytochrome c5